MPRHARKLLLSVVVPLLMSAPVVADETRGKLLYENHCMECHQSTVHVREQRKVEDRAGIMRMVVRFSDHLELDWSAAEMRDVADHLAAEYYGLAAEL